MFFLLKAAIPTPVKTAAADRLHIITLEQPEGVPSIVSSIEEVGRTASKKPRTDLAAPPTYRKFSAPPGKNSGSEYFIYAITPKAIIAIDTSILETAAEAVFEQSMEVIVNSEAEPTVVANAQTSPVANECGINTRPMNRYPAAKNAHR